jgi:L-fucose mutarotase
MLRGISPLLSPDLLATLCRMGHGDEIVLADAHFPGESLGVRVLRADGLRIAPLLDAILPLFVLDSYTPDSLVMMAPLPGDVLDRELLAAYRQSIEIHTRQPPDIVFTERPAFYTRAHLAFAVVMTGEVTQYGNIILKKGVTAA